LTGSGGAAFGRVDFVAAVAFFVFLAGDFAAGLAAGRSVALLRLTGFLPLDDSDVLTLAFDCFALAAFVARCALRAAFCAFLRAFFAFL